MVRPCNKATRKGKAESLWLVSASRPDLHGRMVVSAIDFMQAVGIARHQYRMKAACSAVPATDEDLKKHGLGIVPWEQHKR